jgi:acetoin utilization deacetylase AcuC-like enzyme
MATALLLDAVYKEHLTGEGNPERPGRVDAVRQALDDAGLVRNAISVPARPATEEELAMCHPREYVALVRREVERGARELSTGDTPLSRKSFEVASLAVGGVLNATDVLFSEKANNAFCAVRPPGHHASATRGMGFCIFNNVAIAARYAQRKYGIKRVLIADWDVHHGNGTQDIFYADSSVLFFSTHQSPWYPGTGSMDETGSGDGKGTTINCPFPSGAGRAEILGAFQQKLLPAVKTFKPQLVILSAGFDSRAGDPLGQFKLTDADFADLTRLIMDIAEEHAGGRLLSVLEGGYSLSGLGAAAAAHVKTLGHP